MTTPLTNEERAREIVENLKLDVDGPLLIAAKDIAKVLKESEARVWEAALAVLKKDPGLLNGDQFKHGWNTACDALLDARDKFEGKV